MTLVGAVLHNYEHTKEGTTKVPNPSTLSLGPTTVTGVSESPEEPSERRRDVVLALV